MTCLRICSTKLKRTFCAPIFGRDEAYQLFGVLGVMHEFPLDTLSRFFWKLEDNYQLLSPKKYIGAMVYHIHTFYSGTCSPCLVWIYLVRYNYLFKCLFRVVMYSARRVLQFIMPDQTVDVSSSSSPAH